LFVNIKDILLVFNRMFATFYQEHIDFAKLGLFIESSKFFLTKTKDIAKKVIERHFRVVP
jgi:hypothetical protein